MQIESLSHQGYEELWRYRDASVGLHCLIAVHSTSLGAALGGCRALQYSDESGALEDALRLARGMSYKNAIAETRFGGGKAVLLLPSDEPPTTAMLEAFGMAVNHLQGRYITTEDMGMSTAMLGVVQRKTPWVCGLDSPESKGHPGPYTARGVQRAIEATADALGLAMDGLKVGILGLGSVGSVLARNLSQQGCRLWLADIRTDYARALAQEIGAENCSAQALLSMELDVYSPCARGGGLNDDSIPQLRCRAVVGAANNQLAQACHGDELQRRGILYAPDYLTNAGGVIALQFEARHQVATQQQVLAAIDRIGPILTDVLKRAKETGETPERVTDLMAEERMAAGRDLQP